MSVDAVGKIRRGRGARKAVRQKRDTNMLPALKRGIPLTEPMSPQQVKRIDNASMDILENVGVVFRDDIALADWKRWAQMCEVNVFTLIGASYAN